MISLTFTFYLWVLAIANAEVVLKSREVLAVYELLDRVLPTGGNGIDLSNDVHRHFHLALREDVCGQHASSCFRLEDDAYGHLLVTATSVSELSAGVGWYLRHFCNMTIGWKEGGGSRIFMPKDGIWPAVGPSPFIKHRIVPWNYLMNVCTHSYSLVWYDWVAWEKFIDWMSLSGINLMLALTGQEEIQYKVFTRLGLPDKDIRSWFNGPAFLTWSRGQNEYGNNICGPLPRSWMKEQWNLQRNKILPRLRSLGIIGQLPAFQGNVPIQLKDIYKDANITEAGDTGWIDSLDPLYGKIADMWMETLIEDFGTDHWYQLDGYFNGGTAPWIFNDDSSNEETGHDQTNEHLMLGLHALPHDDTWFRRGVAAYTGLNRTDPDAIWSFQGFSFVGWSSLAQASFLKGFVDSAPKGKFVVIDMSYAKGEWMKWNNASFFGAPFVWTALHNFGATDGMKGDLRRVNRSPFDALYSDTSIFGFGATPEGINQNPAYYEFLLELNFRSNPVDDLHAHMVARSHKRYGLMQPHLDVTRAWTYLVDSVYSQDLSVQDRTGIPHLWPRGGDNSSMFEKDRRTPKPFLCEVFWAWKHLIHAAEDDEFPYKQVLPGGVEPFRYDLINVGREVLAQISTPAALNFSEATTKTTLNRKEILRTGFSYAELLNDVDTLVATDTSFLLGPWIESARRWGATSHDCYSSNNLVANNSATGENCERFYEWNARTQITTWNPTEQGSTSIPGGPIDYAAKHWSGLIKDYYRKRVFVLLQQALKDEAAGVALNQTEVSRRLAQHAYNWTNSVKKYPTWTIGDAAVLSRAMFDKYNHWFASCKNDTVGATVLTSEKLIYAEI